MSLSHTPRIHGPGATIGVELSIQGASGRASLAGLEAPLIVPITLGLDSGWNKYSKSLDREKYVCSSSFPPLIWKFRYFVIPHRVWLVSFLQCRSNSYIWLVRVEIWLFVSRKGCHKISLPGWSPLRMRLTVGTWSSKFFHRPVVNTDIQ